MVHAATSQHIYYLVYGMGNTNPKNISDAFDGIFAWFEQLIDLDPTTTKKANLDQTKLFSNGEYMLANTHEELKQPD